MKERIYIETSIASYLAARTSHDLITAGRQRATHDWWERERSGYDLFTSAAVLDEAARGDDGAAHRRGEYLSELTLLDVTDEALQLSKGLISSLAVPRQAHVDAIHIAVATVNGMELLLTWNFKHIANPHQWHRIDRVCRLAGYELPVACSPDQLLEAKPLRLA